MRNEAEAFVTRHSSILVIEAVPCRGRVGKEVARQTTVRQEVRTCPLRGALPVRGSRNHGGMWFFSFKDIPETISRRGVPPRPPILCAGCMHRSAFFGIKKVFKEGIYPSDIGCYTLGLQMGVVDTTICMGASIPVGSGIAHSGEERDVICTIGDSTFLHTDPGLVNAVQ